MKWQKQTVALIISVVLLAMFSGIMSAMDTDGIENRSSSNSGQSMSPVIAEEEITVGAFSKGVSIASPALQLGWPKATGDGVSSSPALGDIDGDGDIEIVVGSGDNKVYAWHHDGTLVSGWPKATDGQVSSSPALGDIDGDGDIEIVVGSNDGKVYAWDCPGTYDPGNIEWGTFHHDVRRTGLYGTQPPSVKPKIISIATDKSCYTIGETVNLRIEINRSDEYPVVTVLELELKEPSDMPDMLYKSPHFIMEPPVFQWIATESIHINASMWVSGGKYSLIATLKEPTTGRVICKDTAWFEIDDLPEKKRVELEIP